MGFRLFLLFTFIGISVNGFSQTYSLTGKATAGDGSGSLPGAAISLVKLPDSTLFATVATDVNGNFSISEIPGGNYAFNAHFLGFKDETRTLRFDRNINLGEIVLSNDAKLLKTAEVEGNQIRTVIKGDTTEMNADAFKTNPDATLEDLVKKMPGIQVKNGTVKAGGEQVQKVLIDGKEFFGDDVSMAMKNLPAQVVDKIQYFDKLSDQAQFTGFDDGNSRRTLNVITKGGVKEAKFGKVYAGGGTNDRYSAGANVNIFKNNRRFTFISQSNNINQQNFGDEDLLGLTQAGGGRVGGRGRMMGMSSGTNDPSNFMVSQQSGITNTNSLGMNFSDSLSPKIKLSASYFFNNGYNRNEQDLSRDYYLNDSTSQIYDEINRSWNNNLNHRLNLRMELTLDSNNSIIYTPKVSWQGNSSNAFVNGNTSINNLINLSLTNTETPQSSSGYSTSQNLLFQHKMKKAGRTVSLALNVDANERHNDGNQYSENTFFENDSTINLNQLNQTYSNSQTYSANLVYSEPLGKAAQIFMNYRPSLTESISLKETNQFNEIISSYSRIDSTLSNRYENTLQTQLGGAGIRLRSKKLFSVFSMNAQYVTLDGVQTFPFQSTIKKNFFNIVPFAMVRYKFSTSSNMRLFYRSSTSAPSVSQLQNVLDNSNPLQLSIGNSDLKQAYSQNVHLSWNKTWTATSRSLFVNLSGSNTSDYIASSSIIASTDTIAEGGITLRTGSQLTRPVNINGQYNFNSLVTWSSPVKWIKSTVNIQGGLNYSLTPGLINGVKNQTNNYGYTGGLVIASNISESLDFNVGYNGSYYVVENTLQPALNNNYFVHTGTLRANWLPWKGLVINTETAYSNYQGLGDGFNQEFILLNAGLGYKFLKKRAGEIKLSVYDLLNQNTSISRTVTGTYVEDSNALVLNRYFMLTFTYTFRKFNGMKAPERESDEHRHMGPPPQGGPGGPPPPGH
ncbi:MAG: outer membrane beta-barrel protein [Bacteroidetes bacterium]|nr:outer membrane beta-barrel protein [Bacteroidota bacterium]